MLNIWKYSTLKFSLLYGHFPTFLSQLSIFVEPLNFCSIREDIKNHNNPENYCRINIDKRRSAEMFLFRKRIYGKWCGGGGRGGGVGIGNPQRKIGETMHYHCFKDLLKNIYIYLYSIDCGILVKNKTKKKLYFGMKMLTFLISSIIYFVK